MNMMQEGSGFVSCLIKNTKVEEGAVMRGQQGSTLQGVARCLPSGLHDVA